MVFTVIGNIPDLKFRLLTGIGLSSGYLQIVKFYLFLDFFCDFFSVLGIKSFIWAISSLNSFHWPFKEAFLLIQAPGVTIDNCPACDNQIVKSDIKTSRKTLKWAKNEIKRLFLSRNREKIAEKVKKREKIWQSEDNLKTARRRSEVEVWGQVRFQWAWKR